MLEMIGAVCGLWTTTERAVAVVSWPAASRTTALSECVPFAIVVVFHVTLYGAPVSSAPRFAPSSLNCTPTTPTLSVALAETLTDEPDTVALFVGARKKTVGAVVSVLPYRKAPRSHAPEAARAAPAMSVIKTEERLSPALMAGEPALRCGSKLAEVELRKSGATEIVVPRV